MASIPIRPQQKPNVQKVSAMKPLAQGWRKAKAGRERISIRPPHIFQPTAHQFPTWSSKKAAFLFGCAARHNMVWVSMATQAAAAPHRELTHSNDGSLNYRRFARAGAKYTKRERESFACMRGSNPPTPSCAKYSLCRQKTLYVCTLRKRASEQANCTRWK